MSGIKTMDLIRPAWTRPRGGSFVLQSRIIGHFGWILGVLMLAEAGRMGRWIVRLAPKEER